MQPVAVIGLSTLFPDASDPNSFWENLLAGKDSRAEAGQEQMDLDPKRFFDPRKGTLDRYYCLKGGYIRDFELDPEGFALDAQRVQLLDQVHQWTFYVAREALRDGNHYQNKNQLRDCGLILGNLSFPTRSSNHHFLPLYQKALEKQLSELLEKPGFQLESFAPEREPVSENLGISGMPAHLAAQALELGGPTLALDAACASSLYSVGLACHYLNAGKAELMLAGAVSAADPFFINMGFSIFQAYPENEKSQPLDQNSGGLFASEGAGMFLLKRLDDALKDGDTVHAVIRSVGWSNDGRGQFVLSPNPKGQVLAFERAYADSGIQPEKIDYVECHATGTPLGDKVELNSMEAFFGKHDAKPKIGSVKSNLGHMLTAAGMGGMTKVILAMKHGMIPPTINVESPMESGDGGISSDLIVRETCSWPHQREQKHSTVSAFGFGGTNAHLLFDRLPDETLLKAEKSELPRMAIIGMDGIFGPCNGLDSLYETFFEGKSHTEPLPLKRWKGFEQDTELLSEYGLKTENLKGAWIPDFTMDFLRFKLPPNPKERLIPQQLLVMEVTDRALKQSGIQEGGNVAVLVAMETELELHRFRGRINLEQQIENSLLKHGISLDDSKKEELSKLCRDNLHESVPVNQFTSFIGNIMASRIASLWDFNGPALTISAEEHSVSRALETAQVLLGNGNVDAVVVSAVDLAGSPENLLLRQKFLGQSSSNETKDFSELFPGEGCGTVVLTSLSQAVSEEKPIWSIIDSIQHHQAQEADFKFLNPKNPVPNSTPGLLELGFSALPSEVPEQSNERPNSISLSSSQNQLGHAGAASGMLSLIKTSLCLQHRVLPAWSDNPRNESSFKLQKPFSFGNFSTPWLKNADEPSRKAAVVLKSGKGSSEWILSENESSPRFEQHARKGSFCFLPISANNSEEFMKRLGELEKDPELFESPKNFQYRAFQDFQNTEAEFSMVLLAENPSKLKEEIIQAQKSVSRCFEDGKDWQTPSGSFFTTKPLGQEKIAFVYPGGFNTYVGSGNSLFEMDPELHERSLSYSSKIKTLLHPEFLFPQSPSIQSEEELKQLQQQFYDSPNPMFESGISSAVLATQVMRNAFGIEPHAAFGYSMGEVSMLFSLGVWGSMDPMSEVLNASPLFHERIAGPMNSVREYWKLKDTDFQNESLWNWYTLRAEPELVAKALEKRERVYLVLINTPQEVVIAGEPSACKELIEELKCESHEIPVTDVVHCPPVQSEYEEIKKVHTNKVVDKPKVDFFSAADYTTTSLDSEILADNIARFYGRTVDFSKLVEEVYRSGARIFIDMGPRSSCARWISENLGDRPHLSLGINRKGMDDRQMILRTLASLVSHKVPVKLDSLFPKPEEKPAKQLRQTITLGGEPIQSIQNQFEKGYFSSSKSNDLEPLKVSLPSPSQVESTSAAVFPVSATANESMNFDYANTPGTFPHGLRQKLDSAHSAFLDYRHQGMKHLAGMILQEMGADHGTSSNGSAISGSLQTEVIPSSNTSPQAEKSRIKPPGVIFDHQDLLEFAGGKISNVFGPEYGEIDTFERCVRLPMDPYLLVSRVTELNAKLGKFEPSTITTEYDIPKGAWFCTDAQIPWAVAVESGQCDLMLISYLGIDFECRGDQVYRLLDCTLTYLDDMPREGQTLRYEISINSFARHDQNLLFFFNYKCYVGDKMVLRMDNGCAGFFSNEDLAQGRGVIRSKDELKILENAKKQTFTPLLNCDKKQFEREELLHLSEGNPASCFGPDYHFPNQNSSLKMAPESLLMTDRVVSVDINGGPWGLGEVLAEKDLAPDHWYFPCHFKDDPVLAGSLMAEGCVQLLQFYLLYLGVQTRVKDAFFQPVHGLPQVVRCRGQVIPGDPLMRYRMVVKEIKLDPIPYAIADIDILVGERVVVDFRDLGVQLAEKGTDFRINREFLENPESKKTEIGPSSSASVLQNTSLKKIFASDEQIVQFALGDVSRCFGEEYAQYRNRPVQRNPNRDFQLMSRVLEFEGNRHEFEKPMRIISEYDVPEDAWFFQQNSHPQWMPYSVLMEIALQPCGFISANSGAMLIYPELDLHYRNLDGNGTLSKHIDLRGKTIQAEVELYSTVASGNTVIQKHRFLLKCEGLPFYEGDTVFGYFTDEALENQTGLDGGKAKLPWLDENTNHDMKVYRLNDSNSGLESGKPHLKLAGNQLNLLDEVHLSPSVGSHGKGYAYGKRIVDPKDWFFPCHFHQDPVMPGSLGVEAILQALQVFCLDQKLGDSFSNPRFRPSLSQTRWKYRGQIIPTTGMMQLELHVSKIEKQDEQLMLVADASLWRDELRIYEVQDISLVIEEA